MIETSRSVRQEERRRTIVAAIVSVAIHLLLLLIAAIVIWMNRAHLFAPEPEEEEPVTLTILPPEPPPEERGFIDSTQAEVTEEVPEDAQFESDQNTRAVSTAEATDDSVTPAVAGEEENLALRDQNVSVGPIQPPSAPSAPSPPTPAVPEQPAEPSKPQPPVEQPTEAETPEPEPEPEEKPEATPEPSPTPPADAELALLDPTLRKPAPRPEPEVRRPETPRPPAPASPPGYQPETRTTRLTGGISNRGDLASIEAMATPLGRFKKMLSDAIGSRWYYYVNERIDLVNIGTVTLRFIVRADGSVEGVRVLSNSSNESLASLSVRSVMEAEIPPIPEEVSRELNAERIELDYSFTISGGRRR